MPTLKPYGERAIIVEFGGRAEPEIITAIHSLMARLSSSGEFTEIVPAYDSLMACYDPARLSRDAAEQIIQAQLRSSEQVLAANHYDVPVCYEGEYAMDMQAACTRLSLSADQIIERHSAEPYRICMMGFIPGFAFLSPVHDSLIMPRHETPRMRVPAGSVGIANWQTGIYGLESPGGWNIIGRTPLTLFDASRAQPFLFGAGDTVQFIPISEEEFKSL